MSLRSSLARLRALPPAERRLLLLAAVLLPSYAVGVRLRGMRGVENWFRGVKASPAQPQHAARMVAAVARRMPGRSACLPAALTLQRILRSSGVESEVRLGVRRRGGRLEAHAWLEREGQVLLDTADARGSFAPLARGRPA